MLLQFAGWMFTTLMVAVGVSFLAAYPPFPRPWRSLGSPFWRDVGAFTGISVLYQMMPWWISDGMQIDIRMVPLALAGWIHGWRGAVTVLLATAGFRMWLGGAGAFPAIVHMAFTAALSLLFVRRPRTLWPLSLLGTLIAVSYYVIGQAFLVHRFPPEYGPTSPVWLLVWALIVTSMWLLNGAVEHVRDRRHLEKTLADELRSKDAVLQLIPYGVLFLDSQRNVTASNQAAQKLLESGALERIIDHPTVLTALSQRQRINGVRTVIPGGPCGERIIIVSAVPLPEGGAAVGLENVTGVVRQEREEANRERLALLGQLAAMAAHEIRNPLSTIKGFLQLLEQRTEFGPHRPTFSLVRGEVEHINRVVGDFLLLSSTAEPRPESIDIDTLLGEVLDVMELQYPDSGVAVSLEGEPGLAVEADSKSVKQILKNLVANAYEAMSSGGRLAVTRTRAAQGVTIAITDTGPGIAPDVLPYIFQPHTSTKSTGTGLGLAISHKLAMELFGQLEVDSRPGVGSTFRLWLPRSGNALQESAASAFPDC